MSMEQKIERIEKIEATSKSNQADASLMEDEQNRLPPNKEAFDVLLSQEAANESRRAHSTTKTALIDEIGALNKRVDQVTKVSPDLLVTQAEEVINKIGDVKAKLGAPDVELKSSVQNLLQNKLSHIDESLRIALSKAGVEYTPQDAVAKVAKPNPIERFLGFLTDGQHQLQRLSNEVQTWHLKKGEISPATMLAVQIKVGFVQQELEFFSSLLNKALESTKTIMNVQV